jgi:hypothetical protein
VSEIKLKPCPFCGNTEIISKHINLIYCSDTVNCGCQIELGDSIMNSLESIRKQWNTRYDEKS